MSDTRILLNKIAAFRQRLESMPRLIPDPLPKSRSIVERLDSSLVNPLESRIRAGSRTQALIESSLRQLTTLGEKNDLFPIQLTARARRLLKESREYVAHLRNLADSPYLAGAPQETNESVPDVDPLVLHFRETCSIIESAIRLASTFPDIPSVQIRLCEGIESIMNTVRDRLQVLNIALDQRNRDSELVDTLSHLLIAIDSGQVIDGSRFIDLVDQILAEDHSTMLRFLTASPQSSQAFLGGPAFPPPVRFVACNSVTVARVIARITRQDPEWKNHFREPILVALFHDIGMLRVPVEILCSSKPLTDDQKRIVESHPSIGAELVEKHVPGMEALLEVVATHHERMDGTGYPEGRKGSDIHSLARLLAVADNYVARCSRRPHRAALDPRTALTDTLLLAESGYLDRTQAQKLLHLSFYPIGSVVELTDGSVGVVVANHSGRFELSTATRPVLALVTDSERRLLPSAVHIDLAESDRGSILRAVPERERVALLSRHYPQWV